MTEHESHEPPVHALGGAELGGAELGDLTERRGRWLRSALARLAVEPRVLLELRAPAIAAVATLITVILANRYSRRYDRNVVDDAMISIRYAENLARGNGLVFNVGERVEGYTNFLWTVTIAPLYWLARLLDVELVRMVIGLNLTTAAFAVVLTYLVGKRLWGDNVLATAAALGVLCFDNSFTCWAVFGLETQFLSIWLLSALLWSSSDHRWRGLGTGVCLALAQMTRPDAALFSVALVASELVAVGSSALRRETRGQLGGLLRQLAWLVGSLVAIYGAYFLWRYSYYGHPFPNTYYVKLGGGEIDAWERGWLYVLSFFEERDWWLIPALGALSAIHRKVPRALVLYLPAHFVYIAYAGGDFFSGHRLLMPQLPLIALCIGQTVATGWQLLTRSGVERGLTRAAIPPAVFAGAAAVVIALGLGRIYKLGLEHGPLALEIKVWSHDLSANRELYRWFRDHKLDGATIATGLIGHPAHFADLPVVDIFGIVDPEVAHMQVKNFGKGKAGHEKKASLAQILERKPTYIVGGYVDGNYWHRGYFWFNEIPVAFAKRGLWQRDALADTGEYLAHTRIDFESLSATDELTGRAFETGTTLRPGARQAFPIGVERAFLNSYHPTLGDAARGRYRSAPFALEGDLLVMRVGGGHDPDKLRVSLFVDGREVAHATGHDDERMGRRVFDIAEHRGRQGILQVLDDADWAWGHIVLDEVVQWKKR